MARQRTQHPSGRDPQRAQRTATAHTHSQQPLQRQPDYLLALQRTVGNQAVQRMLQRVEDTQQAPKFEDFLFSVDKVSYIFAWAEKQFITEMVSFIHAVRHYKKAPSRNNAQEIYDNYIRPNSTHEVNIGSSGDNILNNLTDNPQNPNKFKNVRASIFDDAYNHVFKLLRSDFDIGSNFNIEASFAKSAAYVDYLKKRTGWRGKLGIDKAINQLQGLKEKRAGHANEPLTTAEKKQRVPDVFKNHNMI